MEGMLWGRGETGNAALGESQARLEAGLPTPHVDRDSILAGTVRASFTFLTITVPNSWVKCLRKPQDQSSFLLECWLALRVISLSSDLFRPWKVFYHELVDGVTKDPLRDQLGLSVDKCRYLYGPYQVVDKKPKYFTLLIHDKPNTVSINRLKPMYVDLPSQIFIKKKITSSQKTDTIYPITCRYNIISQESTLSCTF